MSIFGANNLPKKICGSEDYSFYSLPVGKPDPAVSWAPGDSLPLVIQKPQKEGTCWYYAIRMLAPCVGPNHPNLEGFEKARKFEKELSHLRKSLTYADQVECSVSGFIAKLKSDKLSVVSVHFPAAEKIKKLAISEKMAKAKSQSLSLDETSKIEEECKIYLGALQVIDKFCKQSTILDLTTYNKKNYDQKNIQSATAFLKSVGIAPAVMFVNMNKISYLSKHLSADTPPSEIYELEIRYSMEVKADNAWEAVPVDKKSSLLHQFCKTTAMQCLGFHLAPWTPKDPILKLIQILNSHGPLFFGGHFGSTCYTQQAEFKKEKNGLNVYCWQPEWRKKEAEIKLLPLHSGVIIGAEKDAQGPGGGFVYWANPVNGRNPRLPEQQKSYAISYKNFITNVQTRHIVPCTPKSCVELVGSPVEGHLFYCKPDEAVLR
jgi:hypothetical protein